MSEDRAKNIKLIIFDVDGVMTDGTIFLFPAPGGASAHPTADHRERMADKGGFGISSTTMLEAKGFNAHDGTGFSLMRLGGIKAAIITKRISETVALRARDLKIEHVYQGQQDKAAAFYEILAKENLTAEQVAYVGDDIIDLPVMRNCGLAIAVGDARERVKAEAHYITQNRGGHGAARDAVEFILQAKGVLDKCIDSYIDEDNPIPPSMDIGKGGDLK